jgi:hypothetical protein
MPIQIQDNDSIFGIKRELRDFEVQYQMTSAEFTSHGCIDGRVPEFDAIEWDFLLMQKRALEEECTPARVFSACLQTKIEVSDSSDTRELIAA